MDLKSIITVLVLWCIAIAAALLLFVYPRYRRKRIDSAPFPAPWLQILRRSLPIYKTMWPDQQKELRQLIKRFVEQKEFVGCAGQHIDDEVRITIAAHACLLLLNRPSHEYQGLKSILVYPSTFKVKHDKHDEFGLVTKGEHFLIGESWSTGKVILAWDSVQRSVHNFADG